MEVLLLLLTIIWPCRHLKKKQGYAGASLVSHKQTGPTDKRTAKICWCLSCLSQSDWPYRQNNNKDMLVLLLSFTIRMALQTKEQQDMQVLHISHCQTGPFGDMNNIASDKNTELGMVLQSTHTFILTIFHANIKNNK